MSSLRVLLTGALCVVGLCAACAKSKSPSAGTNTNWLKECKASADCNGNAECLCGSCTLPCSGDAACSPIDKPTRCTPLTVTACGAEALKLMDDARVVTDSIDGGK